MTDGQICAFDIRAGSDGYSSGLRCVDVPGTVKVMCGDGAWTCGGGLWLCEAVMCDWQIAKSALFAILAFAYYVLLEWVAL